MSTFDDRAATWDDDPAKVERADRVADLIRSTIPLAPAARVLEFGSGTGLLSQSLAPTVGDLTLVEPSAGMRTVIAGKIAAGHLPASTRVWTLDLQSDPVPQDRFDLVVALMALHHVSELPRVLQALADLLAPGGHLAIIDLMAEDGSFHGADFHGHNGFDAQQLADQLTALGLVDVTVQADVLRVDKAGARYPLFLLTATRPSR